MPTLIVVVDQNTNFTYISFFDVIEELLIFFPF